MSYLRGKKIVKPVFLSLKYEKYLLIKLRETKRLISSKLLSKLSSLKKESKAIRNDDYLDDIERITQEINNDIDVSNLSLFVFLQNLAFQVLQFTSKSVVNSLPEKYDLSIVLNDDIQNDKFANDLIKSWSYTNFRLISLLNKNLLNDVVYIIQSGFRADDSLKQILKAVQKKFKSSSGKTVFLAQSQIRNLHEDYALYSLQNLKIAIFEWLTELDERVRPSHAVLHGKICSVDDQTIYKNNPADAKWLKKSSIKAVEKQPAEDYNCRCGMRPIIKI